MSQPPYGPPVGPAPWPGQAQPAPKGPSRWPAIIAIAIALVAVAVAVAAWFRPAPKPEAPAPKTYSAQEVADAKKAVCEAYARVGRALHATGAKNGRDDPTAIVAVAVNVRLALSEGANFLSRVLQENPATPQDLQAAVRKLSNAFESVAIDQLGEAPQTEIDPSLKAADSADAEIKTLCQ